MPDSGRKKPAGIRIDITDEIDLHAFHPREVRSLIHEYLRECRKKRVTPVRIIHGKGAGILRRIVHAELDRIPWVIDYHIADGTRGHWGATIVYLDHSNQPGNH